MTKKIHNINRNALLGILFADKHNLSGVEVGTFKGEFSREILNHDNVINLYMVDVWRPLPREEYDDFSNHENYIDVYKEATENINDFVERAHMLRCRSNVACNLFADESLDFVYIDANHTYQGVKDDINCWYSKVKKGGIFFGHDYLKIDYEDNKDLPIYAWNPIIGQTGDDSKYIGMFGVNPAIDEFTQQYEYELNITDEFAGTWWIIKK